MNRQLEDKIWSSRPEVEERPEGWQRSYPEGNGWQDFQQDYYLRYHRRPPDSLRMWLQYAKDNKCNERDFYTYIEEDLKSYREQINRTGSPLRYPDVISSGQRLTDNYIAFTLENHQLNVVASHNIHLNFVQQSMIERNIRKLLLPLLAHQPPFQSVLFFDLHDHPSRGTTSDTLPLFSVCKMRYMTEDKRPPSDAQLATFMDQSFTPSVLGQRHQYTRLQADASIFHPEFTDSYDSRGIMVPYHFGLNDDEEASPNPSMPALKDRKDAIVWRGSTTGSEWGVSPRFHLVERFGGNDAHPIALSVPVIADFAFVDIVQNYTDKHTMSPHWRVSRRMEPEEAQLFKYIMDVDGNSFTARFPRLLRLGSVLFNPHVIGNGSQNGSVLLWTMFQ
ncbi:expressed unknown protein [Seminavis robusta]|uniref:Uncharacterized protein n=1 Tax=Seminavis robusta TaxID=568900 RepID=A0A9N8EM81_9STRA|nr:expressed unknown protein [Seminavis robusta]|eukprot:Sro1244_g255630.1 n/a (391) ;mRNA; r:27428-28699